MLLEIGITLISIIHYIGHYDVQGVDPMTGEPVKRSGRSGMTRSQPDEIIRVPSVPLKRPAGTFGSLIYNKPEVENLY